MGWPAFQTHWAPLPFPMVHPELVQSDCLAWTKLITPRGAAGCRDHIGTQLVESGFGLVGGEEIVQGRHVGRLVRLPEGSLILGERAEVRSAAGGGHAPIEAGARGAHAHARCLEAHGGVEAVGQWDAHGDHHGAGAGAGEGRHGGALNEGRPRRVGQGQAVERRLVLEETAGQILSLPKRQRRGRGIQDLSN